MGQKQLRFKLCGKYIYVEVSVIAATAYDFNCLAEVFRLIVGNKEEVYIAFPSQKLLGDGILALPALYGSSLYCKSGFAEMAEIKGKYILYEADGIKLSRLFIEVV